MTKKSRREAAFSWLQDKNPVHNAKFNKEDHEENRRDTAR